MPRPPRRRPSVERDVSTKKPNNRVHICSINGAGCLGLVGVLSDTLLDSVNPDADSAPSRKVQRA